MNVVVFFFLLVQNKQLHRLLRPNIDFFRFCEEHVFKMKQYYTSEYLQSLESGNKKVLMTDKLMSVYL